MADSNLKILLLVGGYSSEREVSKMSSKSIFKALVDLGYDVKLCDPAYGECQPTNHSDYFDEDNNYSELSEQNILNSLKPIFLNKFDLVFNGLHGGSGEDGKIQSILELAGVKFTGAGVLASALSMDKYLSKLIMNQLEIPNPDYVFISDSSEIELSLKKVTEKFGFPAVVKPNVGGSTVGLTVCKRSDEYIPAVMQAFQFSESVLIEKYIPGKELTVGVLVDRYLAPLEIVPKSGFYDFEAKYTEGKSEYIVPAPIDKSMAKSLQNDSLKLFKSLNCKEYARVDFRLNENNEYFCLEINTLPGMTSHSLVPKMAKYEGISFNELVKMIVVSALDG